MHLNADFWMLHPFAIFRFVCRFPFSILPEKECNCSYSILNIHRSNCEKCPSRSVLQCSFKLQLYQRSLHGIALLSACLFSHRFNYEKTFLIFRIVIFHSIFVIQRLHSIIAVCFSSWILSIFFCDWIAQAPKWLSWILLYNTIPSMVQLITTSKSDSLKLRVSSFNKFVHGCWFLFWFSFD